MKKSLFLFFALFLSFSSYVFADPWDCMSESEAKELITYLKSNPFVVDYCDCCDNVSRESGESGTMWHLIKIEKMEIKTCTWDETQFSVEITKSSILLSGENTEKGYHIFQTTSEDADYYNNKWAISLNYCFTLAEGKVQRLFKKTSYKGEDFNCNAIKKFPEPKLINDNPPPPFDAYGIWTKEETKEKTKEHKKMVKVLKKNKAEYTAFYNSRK